MDLRSMVDDFAVKYNCVAGICSAEPDKEAQSRLEGRFVPFVSCDARKRTDPALSMPEVKSIIVIGMRAPIPEHLSNSTSMNLPQGTPVGLLSDLGIRVDYHAFLKSKLEELAVQLNRQTAFRYKISVDGGILDERALAVRAGLGFWGWNGMVISPVFGPFFNIGCMLTDIEWQGEDISVTDTCSKDCRLCIEACPGQAIAPEGYRINASRCVSYLTQKPGRLTQDEMSGMGCHLYGCDICRRVCPFGTAGAIPQEKATVALERFLTMDTEEFTRQYGHTAMTWRGVELLRRNALIALGNISGDNAYEIEHTRFMSIIRALTQDPNEAVAAAAQYVCERHYEKSHKV